MGLPKKLTEQQMKFAYELVTNEGRKTATECAVDAGFAKDSARQYASKLQNPKLYPLVVKYIGELREEWQKKYEVTYEKHIAELGQIRKQTAKKEGLKTTDDNLKGLNDALGGDLGALESIRIQFPETAKVLEKMRGEIKTLSKDVGEKMWLFGRVRKQKNMMMNYKVYSLRNLQKYI
jgi:phage terminase small subunit